MKIRTMLSAGVLTEGVALTGAPAHASPGGACDPDAKNLLITFQPVENVGASYVRTHLTVADKDQRCALGDDWALYFNSVRQPMAVYPAGTAGDAARQQLADQGLTVARADTAQSGDFYVMKPTSGFSAVGAGQARQVTIDFELWMILKTDAPAGFSISYGGKTPRWVPAKILLDPADPEQTTAFSGDARPVQTTATRYADDTSPSLDLTLKQRLLPQPASAVATGGTLRLSGANVQAPKPLANEASYLRSALSDVLTGGPGPVISLGLDPAAKPESYTLTVDGGGVAIRGGDAAGVLYGIQTLRQLIPASPHRQSSVRIPRARIADAPLFSYRGLQIDVARHFQSKQTIEKFLDLMSFLKLNALHLHLSDDEGWRLQIPGLPELTGFGGQRGFDLTESKRLHQAMGSGTEGLAGLPKNATEANLGTKPAYQGYEDATVNFVGQGSGYFSTSDFEQILTYATQRHIQVIPEFDFPAHARAAVQSEERRFQATGDSTYRLLDPADTSHHVSVQGYTDNLANPCLAGTYNFLTKVTSEVGKMYAAAGAPLNVLNMGGDEAPGPNRWQGSPACAANPDTAGKTDAQLWDYFQAKYNAIDRKVAPHTAGWEDVLLDGGGNATLPGFIALPWQNVWGWGREQVAYQLANAGTPVILAHATNLYMDLAYNKDPNEPGYYWAEFVDEKSTFTYQPFDVYANATEDRWGNPFTADPSWTQLTGTGKKNILGMEAQLWGENGKSPQLREYQAFPKLLGVAERAWNQQTPTPAQMPAAWNVFNNTLGQVVFPLLSYYHPVGLSGDDGVNYRIPLPGGQISGGVLTANVRDPGLTIQYSTDGAHWQTYRGPVHVTGAVSLRTLAPDGRVSRVSPLG